MIYETFELPFTNLNAEFILSHAWVVNLLKRNNASPTDVGIGKVAEAINESEPLVHCKRVFFQRKDKKGSHKDTLSLFVFAWDDEQTKTMFMLKYT
jgi:hypothetical protein